MNSQNQDIIGLDKKLLEKEEKLEREKEQIEKEKAALFTKERMVREVVEVFEEVLNRKSKMK